MPFLCYPQGIPVSVAICVGACPLFASAWIVDDRLSWDLTAVIAKENKATGPFLLQTEAEEDRCLLT